MVVGVMVVVVVMMVVRVVREFQAGVASVQRILDGPLLLSAGRRQAGVGAGPQHVAVVIVHRLGRMLTRRASGGISFTKITHTYDNKKNAYDLLRYGQVRINLQASVYDRSQADVHIVADKDSQRRIATGAVSCMTANYCTPRESPIEMLPENVSPAIAEENNVDTQPVTCHTSSDNTNYYPLPKRIL
ncbi:hypothetical protein AGLY_008546 [Aphis glycines]|uniref:Uncharacterized protein n=1 Tax=Aphis glycines TaxID=307491 RepID=A0A6G0TLK5_APHGL|nr:hypothetical protein AGLY_008546 [Aphis glycines]